MTPDERMEPVAPRRTSVQRYGGKTMKEHCCQRMAEQVALDCDIHRDRFDCPDCLISYSPKFDEYGIIIHDGGTSSVIIQFCPWCGATLPPSKREEWLRRLAELGYNDPCDQVIPEEFESDAWYVKEGNA